jgi:MFS family permease
VRPRRHAFPQQPVPRATGFTVKDRGRPSGVYTSGAYIGPAIAPPLLTALMLSFGWRTMFVVMGIAGLLAAIVWFVGYRDTKAARLEKADEKTCRIGSAVAGLVPVSRDVGANASRVCTGYVSWMYQTWLPAYLEMQQHISIAKRDFLPQSS